MYKRVLAVTCAIVLAGAFVACNDTNNLENQVDDLSAQVQSLSESNQRTQMLTAVDILDNAGLHDIDESANDENEIPAGASGPVERAVLAIAATDWPEDLQSGAESMRASLEALLAALESEDVNQVASAGTDAHDTQHEFSEEVRNMIAQAAGLPVEEHEEDAGSETPEAEASPTE